MISLVSAIGFWARISITRSTHKSVLLYELKKIYIINISNNKAKIYTKQFNSSLLQVQFNRNFSVWFYFRVEYLIDGFSQISFCEGK